MKAIDLQTVLMSKEKGAMIRDPQLLAELTAYFRSPEQVMRSEEELVRELREFDVKIVLLCAEWKFFGWTDWGEVKDRHDYVGELKRKYPDVILGAWVGVDPDTGHKGLQEVERCIKDLGTYGIAGFGAVTGTPVNDKLWYPFYELCVEAGVPIKLFVGHIAIPGRVPLWTENPIPYVDDVALKFPNLVIICAHHPWPFHHEMVSVMLHYPNVYNEQHGWSPKYFPQTFKEEISRRIQDKVMFGTDYPFFSYERMFKDWEGEGYKKEVLEKIYYKNAARVLGLTV